MLRSYKWDGYGCDRVGWVWDGNLCVGLLYEHRFAVLINVDIETKGQFFLGLKCKVTHNTCCFTNKKKRCLPMSLQRFTAP